jgi:PilZ domain
MSSSRVHRSSDKRRLHHRYPIKLKLEYRLLCRDGVVKTGQTCTVNISSSGVLFESDDSIRLGMEIELSIAWPARLNNEVGLQLCATGRTVRVQDNCTAVKFLHHEFRTRSIRPLGGGAKMSSSREHRSSDKRRLHHRYPIKLKLEYRLLCRGVVVKTGQTSTVNISSSGVLFESDDSIRLGMEIELSIAWPARLNNEVGLQLCATGRTVRAQDNCTAVEFLDREFRTRGIRPLGGGGQILSPMSAYFVGRAV